jgi:hypothetical protein
MVNKNNKNGFKKLKYLFATISHLLHIGILLLYLSLLASTLTIPVDVEKIKFPSTSLSSATRVVLGQCVKKRTRKGQKLPEKSLEADMKAVSTRALTHQSYVIFLVVSHMTVSSTMLILNKAVLKRLPVATTVLLAQVGSSAVILWVLGQLKVLTVDPFQLSTVS